jgi:hypothetical protein
MVRIRLRKKMETGLETLEELWLGRKRYRINVVSLRVRVPSSFLPLSSTIPFFSPPYPLYPALPPFSLYS